MEPLQIQCPHCNVPVGVRPANVRLLLQCPSCRGQFRVPSHPSAMPKEAIPVASHDRRTGARPEPVRPPAALPMPIDRRPTVPDQWSAPKSVSQPTSLSYRYSQATSSTGKSNHHPAVMLLVGMSAGVLLVLLTAAVVLMIWNSQRALPFATGTTPATPVAAGDQGTASSADQNTAKQEPVKEKPETNVAKSEPQAPSLPAGIQQDEDGKLSFQWTGRQPPVEKSAVEKLAPEGTSTIRRRAPQASSDGNDYVEPANTQGREPHQYSHVRSVGDGF